MTTEARQQFVPKPLGAYLTRNYDFSTQDDTVAAMTMGKELWLAGFQAGRLSGLQQAAEIPNLGKKLARELRRLCNTKLSLLHQSAWYMACNELEKIADSVEHSDKTASCPTCGSDKREVKFTSHFSGMPILECPDPWHSEKVGASPTPPDRMLIREVLAHLILRNHDFSPDGCSVCADAKKLHEWAGSSSPRATEKIAEEEK